MTLEALTELVGVWLAAFLTLAVFSFLFKDNLLYKFAEHLVVGVSAGYTAVILFTTSFMDLVVSPLKQDFSSGGPFSSMERFQSLWLHVIPLVLGLMMLTRLVPGIAWLSRVPLALFLGVGSGLGIPTFLQTFVIQPLRATLLPLVPTPVQQALASTFPGSFLVSLGERLGFLSPPGVVLGWWHAVENLIIVAGTFSGIVYFFFSKEHKGVTGRVANLGIWILMIGFGSTFGFTVMSRVSLLVGRFEFLINDWLMAGLWRVLFPAAGA